MITKQKFMQSVNKKHFSKKLITIAIAIFELCVIAYAVLGWIAGY